MEKTLVSTAPASDTVWSGSFELQNNIGVSVSNLIMMHSVKVIGPSVGGPYQLDNNASTPAVQFSTISGESDDWYISFTDVHGVLWTAQLSADFHSGSAGSVVELSIGRNSDQGLGIFTVNIGGSVTTAEFNQAD